MRIPKKKNRDGQLGISDAEIKTFPMKVDTSGVLKNLKIVDMCVGSGHSLVLDENGFMYSFGSNDRGLVCIFFKFFQFWQKF